VLESIHHIGVSMMTEIRGSSNAKAKRELGWVPAHPTWRGVLGSAATR
jgi:2-alkyl-3-oxoalkanoate reductase